MTRRPAFLPVFHRAWIALATAVLLASCTVVPAPATYSYQQTACPPGMAANAPPPPAQNGQPAPAPAACYTAVPSSYTYNYYPSTYPAYGYPYGYAPYYGPAYYGPSVGIGIGFGGGWHHRHW